MRGGFHEATLQKCSSCESDCTLGDLVKLMKNAVGGGPFSETKNFSKEENIFIGRT